MQFATPTTKTEMLQILKEIFVYYRLQPTYYEGDDLEPITLDRMDYSMPTSSQLASRARALLAAKHTREIAEKEVEINAELSELHVKLQNVDTALQLALNDIENSYAEGIKKVQSEGVKKGLNYSDVLQERIMLMQSEKADKLAGARLDAEETKTVYNARIAWLEERLDGLEDFYYPIHEFEITAKAEELKDDAQKIAREVFEYNNGLERKEKESANAVIRMRAQLELQYLEIRSKGLTKEELIDCGYYQAVMDCVDAYYSTLDDVTAYNDFKEETELIQYLADYYQDMLFLYRTRAADSVG